MKHTHLYKRVNIGSSKPYLVYACQKPGCSHYLPAQLLVNKKAECPRCGEEYVIEQRHLELVNPHCNFCGKVSHDAR